MGSAWRFGVSSLKRFGRNDQFVLSVLAVVIGVGAGLAAALFRLLISYIQFGVYGFDSERVATLAAALPWWHLLLVPCAGGLIIGYFTFRFMPDRRPHGVANVMEASALHGGRMSLDVGLKAALACAASIGVGASVGREGPVVHLGASLGSWLAQRLHLGRNLTRTLLGCGVAAAVACSFNAPIAGSFFALEVVIGHYALSAFAPIVISSVTGTLISRMIFGHYPAFTLPTNWSIVSLWEFPAFALLGVVSAVAAILFMKSVFLTADAFEKTGLPFWLRPALGGLALGAIAIFFPQVIGVGYEATDAALSDHYPLWLLLALIGLKAAATALCLGSGFSGGVFSPSLFIGAMVGGAFGVMATAAFPQLSSGHGAYTMIGMGAVAGATLGAPISTILMIFEMTSDYELTIAVMIATVIASVITQQVVGQSYFTWYNARRGISISGGHDVGLARSIKVTGMMDDRFETISLDATPDEVRHRLQAAPWGELFVVDEAERLVGTITFSDLHEAAFDTSRDSELSAGSLARKHPTVLKRDDDLETAVRVYGATGDVHLPVVDEEEGGKMLGVVHEHEVMLAYHRALDQARAAERSAY